MHSALILPAFGVVIGIIMAYLKLAFKLSVHAPDPIDKSNPFSSNFILKNDSILRLNNVRPHRVIIRNINNLSMGLNINLVAPAIPTLAPGETTTFRLPVNKFVFPGNKIAYINIEIVVFYNPAFITFWEKEKHFRFVTIQTQDGNLVWTPKAMSER